MKSKLLVLIVGLFLVSAVIYGAIETTSTSTTSIGVSLRPIFGTVIITNDVGDTNDFTETLNPIYGYLDRIVIDATGTDTDYDIILKDENDVTLFSKLDCSTSSDPYSYILSEVDVDDNVFPGIPVGGECTLELANMDGANITALSVTIYYFGYYR